MILLFIAATIRQAGDKITIIDKLLEYKPTKLGLDSITTDDPFYISFFKACPGWIPSI